MKRVNEPVAKGGLAVLVVQMAYMLNPSFEGTGKRLDGLGSEFDRLIRAPYAKLARLERWFEQAARQAGIKLEY